MQYENEIIMLFISLLGGGFVILNLNTIKKIYAFKILLASFGIFIVASMATNMEHLVAETVFNVLEHAGYMASVTMLFVWCILYRNFKRRAG